MNKKMIPATECERGRLYRVRARNFHLAVYTNKGDLGFIGVRQKFDYRYPFEEYHYDGGPPFGTVQPFEALDEMLPEGIELVENFLGEDEDGKKRHYTNEPLLDWLEEMEKKYPYDDA